MARATAADWLVDSLGQAFREAEVSFGRFNLAIFGKTGVGKSTLINAIFGEDVARTGIGKPVTQHSHLYLHKTGTLGVMDTRGLEVGKDNQEILTELSELLKETQRRPLKDQIHVAWYCVRYSDRRFEETEADFITKLTELGLPVILVITQVPMKDGQYHPDAVALAQDIADRLLPVDGHRAFMTSAINDPFLGSPAHGLQEVLDATFRVAPDGVENAITAAQKIDLNRKQVASGRVVAGAAAAAAAAGASPIPFSDAAILVPIQLAMMAGISLIYGVAVDKATTAAVAATTAATTAGRTLVTGLIKLVPGVGSLVGGTISATVAAAITFAMGQAWTLVCLKISQGELQVVGGALDNEAIRRVFMEEFGQRARKRLGTRK